MSFQQPAMMKSVRNKGNVVYAAPTVSSSSGMAGSGRRKASKIVIQRNPCNSSRSLVLFRKQGLRVCTLNTRSLNFTGAATLLDMELQQWNIQLAGLQEVRWPDSRTKNVGDSTSLWSGRKDGYHQTGVALDIHRKLMSTCLSWTPVDECILSARFRHTAGHMLLWHMLPLNVLSGKQRKSSTRGWRRSLGRVARDLKVALGDFNVVSDNARLQGDTVIGP